jgi:hypothetical protein
MGVSLSHEEFEALVRSADRNNDGQIDIDEFMYIMSGADQSILSDTQASAALVSIRRSRKLKPTDFLRMFAGVPQHFINSFIGEELSMRRLLPEHNISPAIDHTGLRFKDV